jgi:hypothetical protein
MACRSRDIVTPGVMTLWLIVIGALLVYGIRRLNANRFRWSEHPLSFAPRGQAFGAVTVAEVAFDYERAILELDDISETTKDRAMWALSRIIVPLVGHVRLDDVTSELETGVGAVLRARLDSEDDWVGHVWDDLLRWGRDNLALSNRHDSRHRLERP